MYLQVTYDTSQFYFDSQKLHDHITSLRGISKWWHYLPNVYLLKVDGVSEKDIADQIIREYQGLRFLVTKIDINTPNGVLPQGAWDWINSESKSSRGFVKIKAKQPSTLRFSNGAPAIPQNKPKTILDILAENARKN